MKQDKRNKRWGLGTKLNILLIACILLTSVGLMLITYQVHSRKVDSFYFEQAERAAFEVTGELPYKYASHLMEIIGTDEFQAVRGQALAANDEQILIDWMREQPPVDYELIYFEAEDPLLDHDGDLLYSLYGNYKTLIQLLSKVRDLFGLESAYLQYYKDGITYTLADPEEGLFAIGAPEENVEAFSKYQGNVQIPTTVYQYQGQWLCTACEPLYDGRGDEENVLIGMGCADINMSDVIKERHWFLINSSAFILLLTLAAMAVSILLIRKLATRPLKLLADGTTAFAAGDKGFSENDVIQLPIRSNDEIGDLYHEIQSMQKRIVEGTDRLTRITAERERVSTELQMAANIQNAMLPRSFPPFPERTEFDLYATMDPAREVGGDFYDFFLIDEDHLALLIADVSDKGTPAALFMMASKILINYRARMGGSPAEILKDVNSQISRDNTSHMFVTVWLGILDINTGVLTCTNAGHEFPFVSNESGAFNVYHDKHGFVVGALAFAKYTDYELKLSPGDAIFVYTDGVPEANNADDSMYGMERLEQALCKAAGQSPEKILESVRADVNAFVDGARQFDDLTMLCLKYNGPKTV